jgi:hypothetical protein
MSISEIASNLEASQKGVVIDRVRSERVDLARVLKKHTGIRRIVEELYPDSAHFIFELLQNAEDTRATEASFVLKKDCLTFEHNGRPFSEKDILGITDVGEGTKFDDEESIGRFGVGFKAVFAYTDSPRIWSSTYSFQIDELVLPSLLGDRENLNGNTFFEFPFNNAKKSAELAYKEVDSGLRDLAESTLLFLNHLQLISWETGDGEVGSVLKVPHTENHIEVLKEANGKTTASSHYLRFTKPVKGPEEKSQLKVATAFALEFLPDVKSIDQHVPMAKQLRVVPVNGQVAVFFPAEKETSNLRFHLHAPFVPELSRASIKDTPANQPLFDQIAELCADALHELKRLGLLTVQSVAVLPNSSDEIPKRYQGIRQRIFAEMNEEDLVPCHSGGYKPAKSLIQSAAALKGLLDEQDLNFWFREQELGDVAWVRSAPQRNSASDRFLNDLAVTPWSIEEFTSELEESSSEIETYSWRANQEREPNSEFIEWISAKPAEWFQSFYAFLISNLISDYDDEFDAERPKYWRILQLSNGGFSSPAKCFFPSPEAKRLGVPIIDIATYTSGKSKSRQKKARNFLEAVGVSDVGEAEEITHVLKARYGGDSVEVDDLTHATDLNRFWEYLSKNPMDKERFSGFKIFQTSTGDWAEPQRIYIDKPYRFTGLNSYYRKLKNKAKVALSPRYGQLGNHKMIVKLAKSLGASVTLPLSKTSCRNNQAPSLVNYGARWTEYKIDVDWNIPALSQLLEKPSVALSYAIWHTISSSSTKWHKARFRPNASYSERTAPSQLAVLLRDVAWVPVENDRFLKPAQVSATSLPAGFKFDAGWEWLGEIRFGEEEAENEVRRLADSEEAIKRNQIAQEYGFEDSEQLDLARQLTEGLTKEDLRRKVEALKIEQTSFELPDREPRNPERRRQKVKEGAENAEPRESEKRMRSVPKNLAEVKEEAGAYLANQYTNHDGVMCCQICQNALPFSLDDGTPYFEKVEIIRDLPLRHRENFLGLCPNHSAMFQHVNGSKRVMRELIESSDSQFVPVTLAKNDFDIYFTKAHLLDLKAVLETDREDESSET